VSIDSITFDKSIMEGWHLVADAENERLWLDDPDNSANKIHVVFSHELSGLPQTPSDLDPFRKSFRAYVNEQGIGLYSLDMMFIQGVPVTRTIIKLKQQPSGVMYSAYLQADFPGAEYLVSAACKEMGVTGMREAIVMDQFMAKYAKQGKLGNDWSRDPYDPKGAYPLMPNKAEDEKYDKEFPEHPLSRLRAYLRRIEPTLKFGPDLLALRK